MKTFKPRITVITTVILFGIGWAGSLNAQTGVLRLLGGTHNALEFPRHSTSVSTSQWLHGQQVGK